VRQVSVFLGFIGLIASAGAHPALAAAAPKKLFCPASWPEDAKATLRETTFTTRALGFAPDDFDSEPEPWSAKAGDEMSCVYGNGRQLLISIPGKPDRCYVGEVKQPKPGEPDNTVYCAYAPTGDPAKDTVNIREMEPLARATAIHGVRLGMTSAELTDALHPKSVSPSSDFGQVFLLPDMGQILVGYRHDSASMAEFRPQPGRVDGLFKELRERFGFPDTNRHNTGPAVWSGEDDIRLVLYADRTFGNVGFPDEYAFLLDGKALAGLDIQLRRERLE